MAGAKLFVDKKLAQGNIVVFSKSYSPDCKLIQRILAEYNLKNLLYVDIESRQDCTQLENYLQILCQTDARSVCIINYICYLNLKLQQVLFPYRSKYSLKHTYDYCSVYTCRQLYLRFNVKHFCFTADHMYNRSYIWLIIFM